MLQRYMWWLPSAGPVAGTSAHDTASRFVQRSDEYALPPAPVAVGDETRRDARRRQHSDRVCSKFPTPRFDWISYEYWLFVSLHLGGRKKNQGNISVYLRDDISICVPVFHIRSINSFVVKRSQWSTITISIEIQSCIVCTNEVIKWSQCNEVFFRIHCTYDKDVAKSSN